MMPARARVRRTSAGSPIWVISGMSPGVRLPLPEAPGRYRVEVRQPAGAAQRSNAVRFMALCSDGPRPLEVITGR